MDIVSRIEHKTHTYIRRKMNSKHLYDYPETQDGWVKSGEPVYGDKTIGTHFDPWVRVENNRFVMYVSDRKEGAIVRIESSDGIKWINRTTVLTGNNEGSWDARVNRPACLFIDGLWYLWFTGQTNERSSIGLAISYDGCNYHRITDKPVIVPEKSYEKISVMNPCVMRDDDRFIMWYAAGEKYEPDVICMAESKDGIHWFKYENNPVLKPSANVFDCDKVGGCDVIAVNDKLVMFYIGYQNVDNARICTAESFDGGFSWNRCTVNPIISPSRGKWDAHAVYKPTVCKRNDSLYLWYNGRRNNDEYIGLAIKHLS